MAIRFDASGDQITASANLPSTPRSFTIAGWFKISTDRNTYSCFMNLSADTNNAVFLETDSDGTTATLYVYNAGAFTGQAGPNMTVGTWYYLAITSSSSGSCKLWYAPYGTWTLSSVTNSRAAGTWTPNLLAIGDSVFTGEFLNGCVDNFKMWTAELTQAELEREMVAKLPAKFASLNRWLPTFPGTTERVRDYSGNAYNMTAGGTLADEDGVSVAWGAGVLYTPENVASGGSATGDFSVTQSSNTLSSAGVLSLTGTLSATQDGNTISAAGTVAIQGALSKTQASDSVASTASITLAGVLSQTQAGDSLSSSAVLALVGTLSQTQAGDTLNASGSSVTEITGELSKSQADNTLSATGNLAIVADAINTQASNTISAAGTLPISGSLTVTQTGDAVSGSGVIYINGALTGTQDGNSLSSTGVLQIVGTLNATLSDNTILATGLVNAVELNFSNPRLSFGAEKSTEFEDGKRVIFENNKTVSIQ